MEWRRSRVSIARARCAVNPRAGPQARPRRLAATRLCEDCPMDPRRRPVPPGRRALAVAAFAVATTAQAQQPIVVQALECRGDEPSWRLDAGRTSAVYSSLTARGKREVVFRGSVQTLGFLIPPVTIWRGDSTHLPRETLVATVREEACRSTMADGPPSTHRAVLSVKSGEAVTGCCVMRAGFDARVAPVADFAAKKPDDWARLLPGIAPAVASCLAREGPRAKAVAKAWPMNGGVAGVRIVQASGAAVDCVADAAGRGTPTITPVDPARPPLPGAGNPLLYPAREPAPIVACGRLERAQGARGALIGYLHYDPC